MYLIEKYVGNDIPNAKYSRENAHLWIQPWAHGKSHLNDCSFDEAINEFHRMTSKVRKVAYRLRTFGTSKSATVAAINSMDAAVFKKYTVFSVGFHTQEIPQCLNVKPTKGTIESIVVGIAAALEKQISSHHIQVRYNSNGQSGGAFLVTDPTDMILSNSEVGISYSQAAGFQLMVSHKFLSDPTHGTHQCFFTKKMDHRSTHDSLEHALTHLYNVVRHATPDEMAIFLGTNP